MNTKNTFEKYIECRKELESLMGNINEGCKRFIEDNLMQGSDIDSWSWGFNDRDTLVIIDYSYFKQGAMFSETVYCSFDEISKYMDDLNDSTAQRIGELLID